MSVCKIGGFSFRSTNDISGAKKVERKSDEKSVAPSQAKTDAVRLRSNPLALMPRMNTISGKRLQHMQSETIESMLKDSAGELGS